MFLYPDTPAMAELHLPPNVTEICSQAYWQIKKHNKRKRQENQQVFSSFWVKIRKEEDWHRMKAIRKHKRGRQRQEEMLVDETMGLRQRH